MLNTGHVLAPRSSLLNFDDCSDISVAYRRISRAMREVEADDPMLVDLWYPIRYPYICEMREKHKANIWTTEDIDFTTDTREWDCLSESEKHVIAFIPARAFLHCFDTQANARQLLAVSAVD